MTLTITFTVAEAVDGSLTITRSTYSLLPASPASSPSDSAGPSVRAVESSSTVSNGESALSAGWTCAGCSLSAWSTPRHSRALCRSPGGFDSRYFAMCYFALALVRLGVHFALPGLLLDHCGGRVPACREDLKPGFYEGIKYNLRQSHLLSSTSSVFISRAGRMATKDRNPAIITRF